MTERQFIGFDRRMALSWLDAAANLASQDLPATEVRGHLDSLLSAHFPGSGEHGTSRYKMATVLLHIWVQVSPRLLALRDDGLSLLHAVPANERLALHWGMCLTTYPFFRDLCTHIGRLSDLYGEVAVAQVTRRMHEWWGERSSVKEATRRSMRSVVEWGALLETPESGVYAPAPKVVISDKRLQLWLVEAAFLAAESRMVALDQVVRSPMLFPFRLDLSTYDLRNHPRLSLFRQGLNEEVLIARE